MTNEELSAIGFIGRLDPRKLTLGFRREIISNNGVIYVYSGLGDWEDYAFKTSVQTIEELKTLIKALTPND